MKEDPLSQVACIGGKWRCAISLASKEIFSKEIMELGLQDFKTEKEIEKSLAMPTPLRAVKEAIRGIARGRNFQGVFRNVEVAEEVKEKYGYEKHKVDKALTFIVESGSLEVPKNQEEIHTLPPVQIQREGELLQDRQ